MEVNNQWFNLVSLKNLIAAITHVLCLVESADFTTDNDVLLSKLLPYIQVYKWTEIAHRDVTIRQLQERCALLDAKVSLKIFTKGILTL